MSLVKCCTSALLITMMLQVASQSEKHYVVLSAGEWKAAAHYLPASGDQKPHAGWVPTQADIESLEAALPQVEKLRPGHPYPDARIERSRELLSAVRRRTSG